MANAVFCARISFLYASVSGTSLPFTSTFEQRATISSGAPFVYWIIPLLPLWTVDIIFLIESNGASPILGDSSVISGFFSPSEDA